MADSTDYAGLLCIGDPHLCSRVPGFRKDDYPRVTLGKLRWCFDYAREHRLLPALLGDLFHYPRDNANWLLVELMRLLDGHVLAIHGNHDCTENAIGDDDTLSVLCAAGRLKLLDRTGPWVGTVGGTRVAVGGTNWGQRLPKEFDRAALAAENGEPRWVFWIAHHDVKFPGYEESGRHSCGEVAGIDLVVNGHIHRELPDVIAGRTTWCNPGNIARVNRGDATRAHVPGALRIDVSPDGWSKTRVPLPFEPFENVFHPDLTVAEQASLDGTESKFVRGLAALQRFKTTGGEGLWEFLDHNLGQFDATVAAEVKRLATEVLGGSR